MKNNDDLILKYHSKLTDEEIKSLLGKIPLDGDIPEGFYDYDYFQKLLEILEAK